MVKNEKEIITTTTTTFFFLSLLSLSSSSSYPNFPNPNPNFFFFFFSSIFAVANLILYSLYDSFPHQFNSILFLFLRFVGLVNLGPGEFVSSGEGLRFLPFRGCSVLGLRSEDKVFPRVGWSGGVIVVLSLCAMC